MDQKREKVVFLCIGNSIRSQMAEAYLRAEAPELYDVYSAGQFPGSVHPNALEVMQEDGISLVEHASKGVDAVPKSPDHVIVLATEVVELARDTFKNAQEHLWPIPDPSNMLRAQDKNLELFRRTRDFIRSRVRTFVKHKK